MIDFPEHEVAVAGIRGGLGHKIRHQLLHFVVCFADPHHDAGFGRETGCFGPPQQFKGSFILGLWPNGRMQTLDGLNVVGQDIRPSFQHGLEGIPVAAKIWNQHLHLCFGRLVTNLADRLGPNRSPSVGQFIAVHRRDHHVRQIHDRHRFGGPCGLFQIQGGGAAGFDMTKTAGSRADITQNHQSRHARRPALAHVGAGCFLANRV